MEKKARGPRGPARLLLLRSRAAGSPPPVTAYGNVAGQVLLRPTPGGTLTKLNCEILASTMPVAPVFPKQFSSRVSFAVTLAGNASLRAAKVPRRNAKFCGAGLGGPNLSAASRPAKPMLHGFALTRQPM